MLKNMIHAQVHEIQQGVDSMDRMLLLINNTDKYESKIKQLKMLLMSIQAEYKKLTNANSLKVIQIGIDKQMDNLKKREAVLDKRDQELADKVETAKKQAQVIESSAVGRVQEQHNRLENKERELADKIKETSQKKREAILHANKLQSNITRYETLTSELESAIKAADMSRAEYVQKQSELKSAVAQFG